MEYMYASLLLYSSGQKIDEQNLTKVLEVAGTKVDSIKVKAVVAALENIDIKEAISKAAMPVAAPVEAKAEKKDEKKDEEDIQKKSEQAVEGLAGLFG